MTGIRTVSDGAPGDPAWYPLQRALGIDAFRVNLFVSAGAGQRWSKNTTNAKAASRSCSRPGRPGDVRTGRRGGSRRFGLCSRCHGSFCAEERQGARAGHSTVHCWRRWRTVRIDLGQEPLFGHSTPRVGLLARIIVPRYVTRRWAGLYAGACLAKLTGTGSVLGWWSRSSSSSLVVIDSLFSASWALDDALFLAVAAFLGLALLLTRRGRRRMEVELIEDYDNRCSTHTPSPNEAMSDTGCRQGSSHLDSADPSDQGGQVRRVSHRSRNPCANNLMTKTRVGSGFRNWH